MRPPRVLKFVGIGITTIVLIFLLWMGYAFWQERNENKQSEVALLQYYDEIKLNSPYDDLPERTTDNKYANIRNNFYWEEDLATTIPRPPEFANETLFPNDMANKLSYSVIRICLMEAGSPKCADEDEHMERHYIGLIIVNSDPQDRHCRECLIKEAFLLTRMNGVVTITARKG